VNSELVHLLLRVLGTTVVLMAVIMLCCVVTPYLAKWIDKKRPRPMGDEEKKEPENSDMPEVRGPYDASSDADYDLNYKIYNKDIYGVEFKNGKKRQK
jgi:Na+-transporting methylmalonyl-CoA/oxaloacetate decarboxylase gamma subunit